MHVHDAFCHRVVKRIYEYMNIKFCQYLTAGVGEVTSKKI